MATDEKHAKTFSERTLSLRQQQHNDRAEIRSILAETVHTAFRKGCENGSLVHAAIDKLPSARHVRNATRSHTAGRE